MNKEHTTETNAKSPIPKKKSQGRKWKAGIGLLMAAFLLQILARRLSGFGQWYAVTVYPILVRVIGGMFGLFPFSVVELGLYAFLAGIVLLGIFRIQKGLKCGLAGELKKLASEVFLILSFLAFSYTANCGVNYYRQPFSAYLDLEVRDSSADELEELCILLKERLEESAGELLAEWGTLVPSHKVQRGFARQARADMKKLKGDYSCLSAAYPVPKPVLVSEILSVQSLSGIYAPFTIEANYNQDMTAYNIPHTACHELSHLSGFMREEEANFIGYLACVGSDSPYSRYSGYAAGFLYVNNALFRQRPGEALKLYGELPKEVLADFRENSRFWKRYEGRIAEASTKINDTYLKANSQADGVKSYGQVVDLLLAYYRER